MSESALAKKLSAALASPNRNYSYRLPESFLSLSPSTPGGNSDVIITAAATTNSPTPRPYIDFASNDFLSLATSPHLRARVLAALHSAPSILGAGSSRLLIYNHAHAMLEARLARTFRSPAALLFNSGFDANSGFFSCIPQRGDALVLDEAVHASVHEGVRSSRVAPSMCRSFAHNDVDALSAVLRALRDEHGALKEGKSSVIVAVESVYSMDGSVAPLREMLDTIDEVFPAGNAHMVVDEAHATGLFGPGGRGFVALLGVEDRVLARLHTFGKALAASGGACLNALT
jgi:8-amino-7-oxononanoate synthase